MRTFSMYRRGLILFFLILVFLSCQELSIDKPETSAKHSIINYLKATQEKLPGALQPKLDAVLKSVNFREFGEIVTGSQSTVIVCNLENFEDIRRGAMSFLVVDGRIVDSRIHRFENFSIPNQSVVKQLVLGTQRDLTGKVFTFNVLGSLKFFEEYDKGTLVSKGIVKPKRKFKSASKTNACIAWYLVVTNYYSDGSSETTESYLNTTCDCVENTYRVEDCSGGGDGNPGANSGGNLSHICGNYSFTEVQASYTAQISGLGMSGYNRTTNQTFSFRWEFACITIPSWDTGTNPSDVFVSAFNAATQDVLEMLDNNVIVPISGSVAYALSQQISIRLSGLAAGSAFTVGVCAGQIPVTQAKYVRDGNCD